MGDRASLDFSHFSETSVGEASEGALGDGEVGKVDFKLFVELLLPDQLLLLLCLFQLVIVEVLSRLGRFVLDSFFEGVDIVEPLDLGFSLLLAHC